MLHLKYEMQLDKTTLSFRVLEQKIRASGRLLFKSSVGVTTRQHRTTVMDIFDCVGITRLMISIVYNMGWYFALKKKRNGLQKPCVRR